MLQLDSSSQETTAWSRSQGSATRLTGNSSDGIPTLQLKSSKPSANPGTKKILLFSIYLFERQVEPKQDWLA
jgi:hypothetical protein